MAWTQPDYGAAPTGETIRHVPANGIEPLTKRFTRFLIPCVCQLPSPHGQPIELWLLNRADGVVSVLPASGDRFEGMDINEPVVIGPGENFQFLLFDTAMTAPPREWLWMAH